MRQLIQLAFITLLASGCAGNSGDEHIESGSAFYLNGEYEKAKAELKQALDKKLIRYTQQEACTILGNIYKELDEYDSAILYHKKAIRLDATYSSAWVNLGIIYRLTSEYDSAERCYTMANKLNPNDPELHASLGALYIFKGDARTAIMHLEKSINLDPKLEVAHSNYALALAMAGEFEKAEIELKKAVALGYKDGEVIKEKIDDLKQLEE